MATYVSNITSCDVERKVVATEKENFHFVQDGFKTTFCSYQYSVFNT